MLLLTKIFHFEMAHAVHGYPGACKNIHGHSYELHVSIASTHNSTDYLPAPGFEIDFKEIKKLVNATVVDYFDHKMVLSRKFITAHPSFSSQENLLLWEVEPTAENMLLYIVQNLREKIPSPLSLFRLKLYETKDSYAEWTL